jgi:plasmid stabilization system protein ParE
MSDAVERHLDEAFAFLDDVPVRELEATAEALERRKDCLGDFPGIFSNVADAREGGWGTDLPRFHL